MTTLNTAKPPVVLVHGMWSTPEGLKDLRQFFESQGFTVHSPPLPGHRPKSEMDSTTQEQLKKTGLADYVESVCQYVFTLPTPPILVGHSMGGLVAQLVAARVECKGLITISSAPPAGINGWAWSVLRTFGRNLFLFPLWKKLTEIRLQNIRYGIANTQSSQIQSEILQLSTYESGLASFQLGMWFLFRHPPSQLYAHLVQCPILILGGTEDKITPISKQRKVAALYKGRAELAELPDTCHWTVGGSNFPLVTRHLLRWLEQHSFALTC